MATFADLFASVSNIGRKIVDDMNVSNGRGSSTENTSRGYGITGRPMDAAGPSSQPSRSYNTTSDLRLSSDAPSEKSIATYGTAGIPYIVPSKATERVGNPREVFSGQRAVGDTQFKQLTWDEYNALDPNRKAAVDFNGLLKNATDKDNATRAAMRKGGGADTVNTISDKKLREGYRQAYKNVFNQDMDENAGYSANTVALLNTLNIKDPGIGIQDYTDNRGYVNLNDLERVSGAADVTPADQANGAGRYASRNYHASSVINATKNLNEALTVGKARLTNEKTGMTHQFSVPTVGKMTDEQRAAFVNSLVTSLSSGRTDGGLDLLGEGKLIRSHTGANVSSLVNPDDLNLIQKHDSVYAALRSKTNLTDADLSDRTTLQKMKFGSNSETDPTRGLNLDEWLEYMKRRSTYTADTVEDGWNSVFDKKKEEK